MADVLTKRQVEMLRTMTAAMLGPLPQKIEGVYTVLDLCNSHEELRRRVTEAESLLQTVRKQTVEALEPDVDSTVTYIRRGRGYTEEEDWQDALRTIRKLIDNAAVKREVNGG